MEGGGKKLGIFLKCDFLYGSFKMDIKPFLKNGSFEINRKMKFDKSLKLNFIWPNHVLKKFGKIKAPLSMY